MESTATVFAMLALILLMVFSPGATGDSTDDELVMLSTTSDLKVMKGDTVLLPCKVKNLGRNVRVWKQLPSNILFSGSIAVSRDSRVSLVNESLQIEKIIPSYAGEYICQVSRHPHLNVLHKIQVQVPSSLSPDPPEGKIVFRKGESATIFCNPSGIPKPHVTWTYGDENMQSTALPRGVRQVHGSNLHFSTVDVHHAGVYKCMAENDVGLPAVATFILNVYYAPDLLIKPEWAHGDEGTTVEFVCTCRSYPLSEVSWLKGDHRLGRRFEIDGRIRMRLKQISHDVLEYSLRIQRLRKDDLGPYTCIASNSVGHTWRTVEISGLAEPARLRGNESGEGSYLLRWKVKSHSPIIEYQLKIRKYKSSDQWTDVVIPASVQEGQGFMYTQSYNVTGLEPGRRYEAVLQAHNDFGWNRPSETFHFGEESELPSTDDMGSVEGESELVPSLLPLYEAELDVTDPPYLEHNSVAGRYGFIFPLLVYISLVQLFNLQFCVS